MYYFEDQKYPDGSWVEYRQDYEDIAGYLNKLAESDKDKEFLKFIRIKSQDDLFFLLYFVLNIPLVNHFWLVPKIYEVQDNHNKVLYLWAREHFKTTIITFGLTIQKILQNRNSTHCIFSNTRSMAKKFLRRVKHEFEENKLLIMAFPEIFYDQPERQAKKWSENEGLLVKRNSSVPEMTIEAHGVTDSMPTGLHFDDRVYDDFVTWDTTRTGEQINKSQTGFQYSHNLGKIGGGIRVVGTRYDYNDVYSGMIKSGDWKVSWYPGDVEPTYWSGEVIDEKRRLMGKYVFASQISLKPLSELERKLSVSWLRHYRELPKLNRYILIDPAGDPSGAKKNKSSYTVIMCIGVDSAKNYYLIDMVRDKLNMREKWLALRDMVEKNTPLDTGYEKYSMQSDIEYITDKQETEGFYFHITPLGGSVAKDDRIASFVPIIEEGRFYIPEQMWRETVSGEMVDLVEVFIEEEYKHWPNVFYKDMLDCLARIKDIGVVYPLASQVLFQNKKIYDNLGWMGL